MQLREVLSGGGGGQKGPTPEERQLEQQREEYGRRGIRYSVKAYTVDGLDPLSACYL